MLSAYPAIFFEEENGYSVIFPDLNYLATCGDTLGEAFTMAVDCLAGYLYWLQLDGEIPPKASPMTDLDLEYISKELGLESQSGFVNMVTVNVSEYAKMHFEKSIKKTLTIPSWLNKAALEQNINFSQVLQNALIDILKPSASIKK